MKIFAIAFLGLVWIGFCNCKAKTQDPALAQEEEMLATAHKLFNSLKKNDAKEFISLIAFRDLKIVGKNEDLVIGDVEIFHQLLGKYTKSDSARIEVTSLFDVMGQRLVKIQLDSSLPKVINGGYQHINLFFGPPNIAPLSRISGYELSDDHFDSSNFKPFSYWQR